MQNKFLLKNGYEGWIDNTKGEGIPGLNTYVT